MALADPTGLLLTGIHDDPAVAALVDDRVRCPEPKGKSATYEGDAQGAGKYKRFVVLVRLGSARLKRAPMQEVRYVARCYGAGGSPSQDATAVAAAVSDAVHAIGRRQSAGGVVIFTSFDDGNDGPTNDPDTQQPHVDVVVQVGALTELLA